jgi:hypothetical protein
MSQSTKSQNSDHTSESIALQIYPIPGIPYYNNESSLYGLLCISDDDTYTNCRRTTSALTLT